MADDVKEKLQKAAEAAAKLDDLRTGASFRKSYEEKSIRFQEATVEGLEALYYQNQVLIELLKGRGAR